MTHPNVTQVRPSLSFLFIYYYSHHSLTHAGRRISEPSHMQTPHQAPTFAWMRHADVAKVCCCYLPFIILLIAPASDDDDRPSQPAHADADAASLRTPMTMTCPHSALAATQPAYGDNNKPSQPRGDANAGQPMHSNDHNVATTCVLSNDAATTCAPSNDVATTCTHCGHFNILRLFSC